MNKLVCYFVEKEDYIEKVGVGIEYEALEKLAYEIREKCSYIVHKEKVGTKRDKPDILRCKKYREENIGISSSKAYETLPDEPLYKFIYDEIVYPRYLEVIIELLNGNLENVDEIFNPIEEETYTDKIEKVSKEIDKIDNSDYENKIKKLEELKHLIETKKLNSDVKPVSEYDEKVKELITLFTFDKMSKEMIVKIQNFFVPGISMSTEIDYEKIPVKIKK